MTTEQKRPSGEVREMAVEELLDHYNGNKEHSDAVMCCPKNAEDHVYMVSIGGDPQEAEAQRLYLFAQSLAERQAECERAIVESNACNFKRAESAEQQLAEARAHLAAAQAALLLTRQVIEQGDYSSLTAKHIAKQPTDALRAFMLGLLPKETDEWQGAVPDYYNRGHNNCLAEIRANLDKALEGKP